MSDLFPYRIETDRLELERLCRENVDLFTYYELCAADDDIEEVTRHLYWNSPRTVMDARELLNNEQRSWEEGTKASYLVRPFEADEDEYGGIAGCAKLFVDWDRDVGELGVWLRKRFWGRGTRPNGRTRSWNWCSTVSTSRWSKRRSRTTMNGPGGRPRSTSIGTAAGATACSDGRQRPGTTVRESSTNTAIRSREPNTKRRSADDDHLTAVLLRRSAV